MLAPKGYKEACEKIKAIGIDTQALHQMMCRAREGGPALIQEYNQELDKAVEKMKVAGLNRWGDMPAWLTENGQNYVK